VLHSSLTNTKWKTPAYCGFTWACGRFSHQLVTQTWQVLRGECWRITHVDGFDQSCGAWTQISGSGSRCPSFLGPGSTPSSFNGGNTLEPHSPTAHRYAGNGT